MTQPSTIKIDEVEYVRKDSVQQEDINSDIKIVVLQRGWIVVGRFKKDGTACELNNSYIIRRWGTGNGLGELAEKGPLFGTELDKCHGIVKFDYLTVVLTLDCEAEKWSDKI